MHLKFGHPADYMHIIKDNTLKNLLLSRLDYSRDTTILLVYRD